MYILYTHICKCIYIYIYIYICIKFPCIPIPFPGPVPWQIVLCPGKLFAWCGGFWLSTEDPAVFLLLSLFRPAPAFRPPVLLLGHLSVASPGCGTPCGAVIIMVCLEVSPGPDPRVAFLSLLQREVKCLVQGYTASCWQSRDLNPGASYWLIQTHIAGLPCAGPQSSALGTGEGGKPKTHPFSLQGEISCLRSVSWAGGGQEEIGRAHV